MTDDELNIRFAQMADAVSRVADASSHGIQRLESQMERVERAQLRFQEQLGDMAGIMRQAIARQDRHEQELEELRQRQAESDRRFESLQQRQAESDQRFDVLLQEIRFLIRQQRPPQED